MQRNVYNFERLTLILKIHNIAYIFKWQFGSYVIGKKRQI